jgi:hypothetical protein
MLHCKIELRAAENSPFPAAALPPGRPRGAAPRRSDIVFRPPGIFVLLRI